MNKIEKATARLHFLRGGKPKDYIKSDQVLVYHHIPKCGGQSLSYALRRWYWVIKNYKVKEDKKVNLTKLRNINCLIGHYHFDGIYLHQIYPEILESDNFKLISFLRDPLQTRISLYYYEERIGIKHELSLEEDLLTRPNFMSKCFPCNEDNYQEVLERYSFIGLLERQDESIEKLRKLLNKPKVSFPKVNKTARKQSVISDDVTAKFKEINRLDYLIYTYAEKKYFYYASKALQDVEK